MEQFTLARTGDAPIRFWGERIAQAEPEPNFKSGKRRWFELALYRTRGGQHVLEVALCSNRPTDTDHFTVEVVPEFADVRPALDAYWDRVQDIVPLFRDESRNEAMFGHLRRQWDDLVCDLLNETADEAAEEIE
jgi:hypothetical protein